MDTRTELEGRLRLARDWGGMIDVLEQEAEQLGTEAERSDRLFQIAKLSEEVVPERDRALAIYQRAWKIFPDNLKALSEARRVYRELGRLEMVAKLGELELKARVGAGAEELAQLAGVVGEALLDCRQRDRALPLLHRALEAFPDSTRLRDAVAAADYDNENWLDIVERLQAEAKNADSSTAARMLLRAARIVYQEVPGDPMYEELLHSALANDAQHESANFLFESVLAAQQRWSDLEEHHDKRAYAAADEASRVVLYRQFALEWVQRFKDRERGAAFFAKAIEAASEAGVGFPALVAAFRLVREVFGARGEWTKVFSLAQMCSAGLQDPQQRLFVALQAGLVAWRELGDADGARAFFDIVRQLEPEAPDLQDFTAEAGNAPSEAPTEGDHVTKAETQDKGKKKKRRRRKKKDTSAPAEVVAAGADASDGSNGADSEAAAEPKSNGEAAEAAEAAAPEAAAPEAAAPEAAAVEQADSAQEPAAAPEAAAVEQADSAQEPAADPELAAAQEPAAAAAAAQEPEPRPEEPAEEISAELQAAIDGASGDVDALAAVIAEHGEMSAPRRALATALRGQESWKLLVDALKDEEKHVATATGKVAALRDLASVYRENLRNDVQAMNALNQAVDIQPDNLDLYDELAAQYEAKKRWPDLVKTLDRKAEHMRSDADRIQLRLQIANLYVNRFSNQAEAIKQFEKVLELDGENSEAISHLMAVYEKRRDWEKLLRLKEGELARIEDPAERFDKVYEVAQLAATRVKKPEVCIVWWEKVLEADTAHEEAIGQLFKLYERAKSWERLAEVCSKLANIAADEKTQIDSLQKLGLLYTDKIAAPDKAIEAWRRLLEIDPNHRRGGDSLKKLYISEGRWDDLEAFYREGNKLDEFVRVLERQVDQTEGEGKLALAMKIAVMYRDEIGKADRALRAFERVLEIDANSLQAAEALIPLYEKGRDPRKLPPVYEIQLAHTEDPATRQERLRQLADYSEEKLRDKGVAFSWWLKAHGEDHEAEWIREHLERLANETGAWTELVSAYVTSYEKFGEQDQVLPLMLVVAQVQEVELGELDAALATNIAIMALDDTNQAALVALERLYLGKQQYEDLLDIYRKKLELTADGDEQTQIRFKIGQLYEDEVGDDAKAVQAYTDVLEAVGDDLQALRALDRLYGKNQKWQELHEILERELVIVGPTVDGGEAPEPAHVELKYRLGQVRENQLDDVVGAIEAYRDILELDAGHEGARQALEARLEDPEHKLAAASILEPIYEQAEGWGKLVQTHEIELEAESDQMKRVGLLMRIGELHSKHMGDADKAFDAFARAFKEDAGSDAARSELEELCSLIDDGWKSLVGLYEVALASGELDPVLAHDLAIKVAQAYQERLDNTEKAIEHYRRALSIEPDDSIAIDALEQIFTRDERYAELLEVLRKRVDISLEPDERLGLLFRIAAIHEEMLESPQDAVETYNEILGHDGDNLNSLRALDRLYLMGEQWQDLGDNLSRQLTLCDQDAERLVLMVRLAQLRETKLGETAAAVETYRTVLDLQPDNPDAVAALERLISVEEQELTIAQILEPIYKATADWQKQIGVYEIMARHAFDPERKIELFHQIAELYELGGDDGVNAFQTYARAFREEPRGEQTQAQLDRLARMYEGWRDLVSLYDEVIGQLLEDSSDDELKILLLGKLAQLHELELGDDEAAVATHERILDVSPSFIEAATAIESVHTRNADYPALVAILKRKSELVVEVPERKQLLYRSAQIQEEVLEDADAAIATFNQVLELDDLDVPAMDALERLYVQLERWEPLKDVYAKQADLTEDPAAKRQKLLVLGQVYDVELKDPGKAIETYQQILDLDPDDLDALLALDRLFGHAERWYDLLSNLERQVELAESHGEIVGLKYRIGHLWQNRLTDVSRAIESYREALEIDPQNQETLIALDGLVRSEDGEPVMAARVLEPIYEAAAEFERLIEVLEVMVTHAEDPHDKVELLHRVAELYEHRLEGYVEAFNAFARALREDNSNEQSLGHLERLADATKMWTKLSEIYGEEAEKSLDVPRQVDLLTRLARVYEDELTLGEEAISTYNRIIEAEFDNKPAVAALDRLYTQTERWQELSGVLRKEIQLAESDEEILDLQFRLGQVLEQSLEDMPGAIEVYRDILSAQPDHSPTMGAMEMMFLEGHHELEISGILEPIYETAGEFEKLHKIYEVQLSKLTDAHDRQSMYTRLAELAEGSLYDQSRAFAWWGEAVVEDPKNEHGIEEAERLAGEISGWEELVNVYIRAVESHTDDSDLSRQSLLRLARVYEECLGDANAAVQTHLRVLEIDAKEPDALAALDRLYGAAGLYEELVDVLRRRIEVTLDGDEILEFSFRRGAIYADALGDLDAALGCYQAVLEQESRNRIALEAIEKVYFRRENWQSLYEIYEKLIDVADGDEELGEIYARMGRLTAEALQDDDAAADLWGRVLDIRGEDPQALQALAELYIRRENWDELVEVIERQVAVTDSSEGQVYLYKRLGRVWEEKLGRERNALDSWLAADSLDPNDLETLGALSHLYRSTQSWEELSQTLQRIIEVGQMSGGVNEDQLIELYAQLGQLEGEILGRIDDAVEAWRRVIGLDPSDFRALGALEQLFTREARWEECIEVLERRSLVLDEPAEQLENLLQAAAIWEEKVEDFENAAAVYERVRGAEVGNAIASNRLEAIYRAQYKWEQLNEILLERVEMREDVYEQIDILGQVAKVYEEELGDQESAFLVLQAAFRRDYAHEGTASQLERLATAAGKWEELLADYSEMVQGLEADSPEAACDLWVKIGRWYGDHLSHVDYAIHSVQQALRINPEHSGALGALADFQRKRGSWGELVETLGTHAALETDVEKKVDLYLSLADLLETQTQEPQQAISAYQNALAADATCMDALRALERLYSAHELWEAMIDTLGRISEQVTDEEEIIRLKSHIGQLWDERMLDSGQAIQAYREVLNTDPSNLGALRALEMLYEKTGQSEQYLEVLEAQLDASPTDAEQISLYERMSSAWEERFGKLDRAAECLEKIVAIDDRNFQAYRELARLYFQDEKWDSLVDTYRNHSMAATDTMTRVDLYVATGEVYEYRLDDSDRAIEAYNDVLSTDPDEPRALDALGRLYEKISEWDRAIDVMSDLVRNMEDPAKRVDLFHRIGRITAQNLDDGDRAEEHFLNALTIDDAHVATMEQLVSLYSGRGDWLKAAQMMVRAESHTENVLDKVRLLHEAALIYLDKLGQREQAKEYFGAVLGLDPEHVEAGEPLAELYFEAEEWERLMPVLDMLVRKAQQEHDKEPRELNDLYFRTAKCADELNDFDRALQYYKAAYDIDSTYLPTLVGRADLLYKMQDWDGAGKIYQTILVQHRDSQDEAQVVRIYYRLGMVRQQLGERRKALNMFEKALEIDPTHRDTLEAVINIQVGQGDYEAVVHAKRSLMATADDAQQVELLDEISAIYKSQLSNPQKAIAALLEALDIATDDHQLLQKVLDLYTETEQWKKAVEVILRFIELEENPVRKGAYFRAAATISRDQLKGLDEAIEYYNAALDNFFADGARLPDSMLPTALKCFQAIDKLLTTKRDWKNQERNYRKMIRRLPAGHSVLKDLWHALGEIYRSRLKHYESAIQAFEIAQELDPSNRNRGEILAELYLVSGPEHADKAIEQHMTMLRAEPFKYDSYKALRKIYMDTHQYDKTWCVCNTLAFLKKADPEDMQFYEQYKPRGFVKAKQRMTEDIWRKVTHHDENRYISAILGAIQQGAAAIRAQPHKQFGLRRKDKRAVETDQLLFSKIFYYTAQVLNVPPPEVYLQDDKPGEILLANCIEKNQLIPSFVVRQNLLQGRPEKEIAFAAAKKLSFMRPEHYLKLALPTNTELKTALMSALVLARPDFPVPPDMRENVQVYLPEMQKRISPQVHEQLNAVVARFLQAAPEVDMAKWGHAVEATSHRIGFIICGDLETAARMVSAEPTVVGGPQAKDKIKELVLYGVSEEYFAVRHHLGLTIG